MFKTIGLMIVPPIILVIVATIIFVKVLSRGEQKYDVFMVEGNELVVLAGIPVRYKINDIETVTFSNVLGKYGSFVGIMKIKKKRVFLVEALGLMRVLTIKSLYLAVHKKR